MLAAVWPRLAAAQSAADRAQARELAGRGFEALSRKDYAAAEELFRRADALVHAPTLELDHARALVGLGKLVEGHERYEQVIREGVAPNAPWQWKRAVVEAQAELAAVDRRMAWLTITVQGGRAPVVEIDGKLVPDAARGVKRATNPGLIVVSARADGFLPVRRSITLDEGQSEAIELTLEPDPHALAAVKEPAKPRRIVLLAPPPPPPGPDRTLPIVLLSAGGAALVAGTVTGIMAIGVRSDLEHACGGDLCQPTNESEYADYREQRDKYRTLGTVSGVTLALGAAATLTGAAVFLFTGKPSSGEGRARSGRTNLASLRVGLGSVSVAGAF
ncbi:MAG TPA: hypothetical protein VHM25_21400 [Polyangiaceae bacterium]|jgi:hypothetical protein|nr:hypothetical protein [Polyangiaceae bacterium]